MNKNQQPKSRNRILSDEQILTVNEYALRYIEEIGCKVQCEEALQILGDAGCSVKDPDRVRIPRKIVMEAIEASPSQIDVFDRDGNLSMVLAEDQCYYGTGSDCPSTMDLYTGKHRESGKQDVANLARFCDALPNIDFVMSFGIAKEIARGMDFVHGYEAMLLNTRKPAIVTGHGRNDMLTMIKMAAAVRTDFNELHAKPCLVLYTEPMSPMIHTEMGVSKGLICSEYGIPFIYIGSPMMGANGPATIEGTLVQAVAECLSGLAIFQLKQPGAKFIFGGDATIMEMRSMIYTYGAPELNVLNACLSDMAHYYHLPFFCIAGATDSKVLDAQAGLEYAISILGATLNGCNLIHDCGYLESGLTSSFESVLFADEVISLVKHMLRPLEFNNESVPFELMDKVGPGGSFLVEKHTLNNYRKRFWFPRFLDRSNYERWIAEGGKDLPQALNAKAREIFEQHQPQPLPENVATQIKNVTLAHTSDLS